MIFVHQRCISMLLPLTIVLFSGTACAPSTPSTAASRRSDPRVGLRAGLMDAGEAISNLRTLAKMPPADSFVGKTNSDLAFLGNYAIQGNYYGWQIWDISNPSRPTLKTAYV